MDNLQLKRYTIQEKIGEGGMADVYLTYDNVLKRECAIKILRTDLSNDAVAKLRFRREADAAAKLQHPNIITIYDVGEANNRPFIVMEYIHGQTLKELIIARGALDKKEAVFLMTQILEGIECAHEAGVIHRDIKPQNIMIKADGSAKVTDFGIASVQGAIQLTQHDSVMGSVHYLAPECSKGEIATVQSDIYSLGIVFYEMLTGEVPYKGDAAIQVAIKHLNEEMRGVREYNNSIEQSLENIIIKATAKNKTQRYQSIKDMLMDLKVALNPEHAHDKKLVLPPIIQPQDSIQETRIFTESPVDSTHRHKIAMTSRQKILLGIIGVSFVALLILLFSLLLPKANVKNSMVMEDYSGKSVEEVTKLLEAKGLIVNPTLDYELNDLYDRGIVIRTKPEAAAEIKEGTIINLTVSEGKYFVVGNYQNRPLEEVRNELKNQMNIDFRVEYEPSKTVNDGIILRQENLIPGEKLAPNKQYELKLIVARPLTFQIPPQIIGMNYKEAQQLLQNQGATVLVNPLDSSKLSDEEWQNTKFETVISVNPTIGSTYTQTSGAVIEISYYVKTEREIIKVDKTQLEQLLNTASKTDIQNKTPESVKALEEAKTKALEVINNQKATQSEIDSMIKTLQSAIDNLVENPSEEGPSNPPIGTETPIEPVPTNPQP